ncbi:AAA family ATPase [Sinorhizobium medicae]|nr:AAA family ATPase [Sinorhizobium medicae]
MSSTNPHPTEDPVLDSTAATRTETVLDSTQLAIVNATERDIRLLAPAGSGKTLSLLHRCAELHHRSNGSASFLIVSFTRAARDELRARLAEPAFVSFSSQADVVTLNGWGHRRLRTISSQPRLHISEFERATMVKTVLAPFSPGTVPLMIAGCRSRFRQVAIAAAKTF